MITLDDFAQWVNDRTTKAVGKINQWAQDNKPKPIDITTYQEAAEKGYSDSSNMLENSYSSIFKGLERQGRDNALSIDNYRKAANASAAVDARKQNDILADYGLAASAYGDPKSGYSEQSRLNHSLNLQNIQASLNAQEQDAVKALQQAYNDATLEKAQKSVALNSDYQTAMQKALLNDNTRRREAQAYVDQAAAGGADLSDYEKALYDKYYGGTGKADEAIDTAVSTAIDNGTLTSLSALDKYKGTDKYVGYVEEYIGKNGITDDAWEELKNIGVETSSPLVEANFASELSSADNYTDILGLIALLDNKKSYLSDNAYKKLKDDMNNKLGTTIDSGYQKVGDKYLKVLAKNNGKESRELINSQPGRKFIIKEPGNSEEKTYKLVNKRHSIDGELVEYKKSDGYKQGQVLSIDGDLYMLEDSRSEAFYARKLEEC